MAAKEAVEAIFRAAREGNAGEVARMLDADPELLGGKGQVLNFPLLYAAVESGHADMVKGLIGRGADVNSEGRFGGTPLCAAAYRGDVEMAALLLRCGAKIIIKRTDLELWTALMTASSGGQLGVMRLLLQHMVGQGLDERDRWGNTALWYACFRGQAEATRALLLAGADHTIGDNIGQTPRGRAKEARSGTCLAVLDWWEGELDRLYVLQRARRLYEDSTGRQQAHRVSVPAYLKTRVERGGELARVQVVSGTAGQEGEEEKDATLAYVMHDLAAELYVELCAGFHPFKAARDRGVIMKYNEELSMHDKGYWPAHLLDEDA